MPFWAYLRAEADFSHLRLQLARAGLKETVLEIDAARDFLSRDRSPKRACVILSMIKLPEAHGPLTQLLNELRGSLEPFDGVEAPPGSGTSFDMD